MSNFWPVVSDNLPCLNTHCLTFDLKYHCVCSHHHHPKALPRGSKGTYRLAIIHLPSNEIAGGEKNGLHFTFTE